MGARRDGCTRSTNDGADHACEFSKPVVIVQRTSEYVLIGGGMAKDLFAAMAKAMRDARAGIAPKKSAKKLTGAAFGKIMRAARKKRGKK